MKKLIKIQHKYLKDVGEFLLGISLKGKESRHRMRIVNVLNEQNQNVAEEEINLLKEYAKLDEDGELIRNADGSFDILDIKEFKKQQDDLYNEQFVINDTNLDESLQTVGKLVIDYDEELNNKDAFIHDYICQQYENHKSSDRNHLEE